MLFVNVFLSTFFYKFICTEQNAAVLPARLHENRQVLLSKFDVRYLPKFRVQVIRPMRYDWRALCSHAYTPTWTCRCVLPVRKILTPFFH